MKSFSCRKIGTYEKKLWRETKKVKRRERSSDRKTFLVFLEKWTSFSVTLDQRLITTFNVRAGDQLHQHKFVLPKDSSTMRHFREYQQIID